MDTMTPLLLSGWLATSPFATGPSVEIEAPSSALDAAERKAWRTACLDVVRRLGAPRRRWRLRFRRAKSPADFAARTGRPRFEAAAWQNDTIWLQARSTLARFQRLQAVRRHECVHAWRAALGWAPLPIVVEEGLASGVSNEVLPPYPAVPVPALRRLATRLRSPSAPAAAARARSEARATVWPHLRALSKHALRAQLQRIVERPHGQPWWQAWPKMSAGSGKTQPP